MDMNPFRNFIALIRRIGFPARYWQTGSDYFRGCNILTTNFLLLLFLLYSISIGRVLFLCLLTLSSLLSSRLEVSLRNLTEAGCWRYLCQLLLLIFFRTFGVHCPSFSISLAPLLPSELAFEILFFFYYLVPFF